MSDFARTYYQDLKNFIDGLTVTDKAGGGLGFFQGIEQVASLLLERGRAGNKLFFIGNGASAAISSHMATDFWKNGGIRAIAFNDGALLTCMGNDYGYDLVFAKPIEMFADAGDVLIAISSSGQSPNILKGVAAAREQHCRVITLSGFQPDNPLRSLGDYNFYVTANNYGPVEILHHSICHCLLDAVYHHQGQLCRA
ncbi:MAG: SIS domain-containing protein [Deltaproteobacteria bacterium]|nr:MAG: SIS domain-containing protein [Deltaproteobacteria bacterium]